MLPVTIAFNTANLVAEFSGYRFSLNDWMTQHHKTAAQTTPESFAEICRKARAAGYTAVEVWCAHLETCAGNEARCRAFLHAMHSQGVVPVGIAGGLDEKSADYCQRMGIGSVIGGFADRAAVVALSRKTGIAVNYENHPEKSVAEIRAKIDFGADGLAVGLDTGWLGTQGVDAPKAIRELGRLIRHVHLKDVAAKGAHHTVALGAGVVDIPGCIRELKAIGYEGVLSWEDEPEDRNPWEIAAEMREYIERHWRG